jgi:hypothetical protein
MARTRIITSITNTIIIMVMDGTIIVMMKTINATLSVSQPFIPVD